MSSKNKIIFIIFITFLMLILFNVRVYAADTPLTLNEENLNIYLNGKGYLLCTGGTGTATWTSSDPTVATVNNNGTVEGLKIGSTTITVTKGSETVSCTVNVTYNRLIIGGNQGNSVSSVNLILGEHASENLVTKVEDALYAEVSNPNITWTSSDTNIVTVDSSNGTITAVNPGTAKITATAAGVSDSCDVNVYAAPTFTDFSKAKYEPNIEWNYETLKITGIESILDNYTNYYYIITSSNSKPDIKKTSYGTLDSENMSNSLDNLLVNSEENYMYTREMSKYTELNQDLYIWILQESKLEDYYYDEDGNSVRYVTKFVNEGKKLERAELPKLNLILQSFNIGYWNSRTDNESDTYTYIKFNFPTDTINRKFKIKIGKVTDNSILTKIKNNDYTGITELLEYAKNHDSIYSQTLTTTSQAYFRSDDAIFNGRELLNNKAYYYIYVEFDDEGKKYYPIEGVTLGQAWFSTSSDSWELWAYNSSDFKWDNLSTTPTGTDKKEDPTIASGKLPQTGLSIGITVSIVVVIACGAFAYFKYNKVRDI